MLACLSEDNCMRERLYGLNFLAELWICLWWPKVYFMGINVWWIHICRQTDMYMFSVQNQSEKTGSFDILFFSRRLHTKKSWCQTNLYWIVIDTALPEFDLWMGSKLLDTALELDWIEEYQWVDPPRLWKAVSGAGCIQMWSHFQLESLLSPRPCTKLMGKKAR